MVQPINNRHNVFPQRLSKDSVPPLSWVRRGCRVHLSAGRFSDADDTSRGQYAQGHTTRVNRLGAHLSPNSVASDVFPDNQLPSGQGTSDKSGHAQCEICPARAHTESRMSGPAIHCHVPSLYDASARSLSIQTTHRILIVLLCKDSSNVKSALLVCTQGRVCRVQPYIKPRLAL